MPASAGRASKSIADVPKTSLQGLPHKLRELIYEYAFYDPDPCLYVERGSYYALRKEVSQDPVANSRCASLYLAGPLLASTFLFLDALPTFRRITGVDVCFASFLRAQCRPPHNWPSYDTVPFNYHGSLDRVTIQPCLCPSSELVHALGKTSGHGHKIAWPGDLVDYRLRATPLEIQTQDKVKEDEGVVAAKAAIDD